MEEIPTTEEIKDVVWSCDPSKAPGLDGFNLNFVRKMWDVVGAEFQKLVLDFFHSGSFPGSINMTWVTLIPKFEGAKQMKELRLISMVGCIYIVIDLWQKSLLEELEDSSMV